MSFYCGVNQFDSIQCSTSPMTISSMLIVLPEFSSRQLYRPASSNIVLYIHSSYLPVLGSNNTLYLDSCLQSGIRECLIAAKIQTVTFFNFGKCKCLHTGPGNTGMNYEMGGSILSKTVKEKDLGVSMNANMKVSEQCRIAAYKAG